MKSNKNFKANLENGVWTISSVEDGVVTYKLTVNDEVLDDNERETLDNGTSNDIQNFINTSGNF